MMSETRVPLDFGGPSVTPSPRIQRFEQIPDILSIDVPEVEYVCPGLVAKGTITLWYGGDGIGKSYTVQKMAVEIARGGSFLERRCHRTPTLYLDFENPAFAVRQRFEILCGDQWDPSNNLKVWGTWVDPQPPLIGSDLLLTIAKETQPVIVVDPLRFAHNSDENDSGQMSAVMRHLKFCAAAGCAVILIHHSGKQGKQQDNSTGRGSSAIRGACDCAILHELTEDNIISLKMTKNRFGPHHTTTIRANFAEGTFELIDSPMLTQRTNQEEKLRSVIEANPGGTQNEIISRSGIMKSLGIEVLRDGSGTLWDKKKDGRAFRYYPLGYIPHLDPPAATKENGSAL
jgi:predicted ATP-dependent serine protease